jgi:hypothetical protein
LIKLHSSGLPDRQAILFFAFEHSPAKIPIEPALRGFELNAESILGIQF